MNIVDSTLICLKKIIDFKGRASRGEFWWFNFLIICLVTVLSLKISFQIIDAFVNAQPVTTLLDAPYAWVIHLILTILSIALLSVTTRRLHDTGRSGWWQLLMFTIIGIIPLMIWCAEKSEQKTNQYGAPPIH
jgi:uncharacterized membrane protein YhaH (DUF805 family)